MSQNFDYESDMKIDCDALDIEWLQQPKLYMKWAELSAKADAEVRRAKENLKIVDAGVDKEVREFMTKVTDSLIKAEVERDPSHQQAVHELNTALYNADICSAAVKAVEQKKYSLENAVKLWIGSYFAGPKEPRNISKEMGVKERAVGQIEEKIREQTQKKAGKPTQERAGKSPRKRAGLKGH